MTEIVAAHLERVAKQARELAKLLEPHLGDAEWYTEESAVETITEFLAAALAACAREAARPFKEALMVDPFGDGQDGDLCLWCRTSYPHGLKTFEEHFLPEHHLSTCELMLVLEKWAALERAVGEKGPEGNSRA